MSEPRTKPRWCEVEDVLVSLAEIDLRARGVVDPCMTAFRGEEGLFLAFLRPFPPQGYVDPMIELLALAGPLRADRLALSLSGRGWSLNDPIPPVTEGVDLRQRILVIHQVDGHGQEPQARSTVVPFELDGDEVRWGEAIAPGPAEGWIAGALEVTVASRHRFEVDEAEIRAQAERCIRLGHDVSFGVETAARIWLPEGSHRN